MAKSRQVQRAQARSTRKADPEARNRTLIVGGIIAAILLVLGIIAYGYYSTQIQPRGKVVLTVGDEKFTLGHVERRMQRDFDESKSIYLQSPQLLESLPDQVMSELTREGKLFTSAGELNIEVTEADVDAEIASQAGVAAGDNQAFANAFRDQVKQSGLHAGEYRDMIRAQVLERKVRDYFTFLAPKAEPQVRARWILVADEDDAQKAITRLEAGEDFAALAKELSQDTSNKDTGGVVEWAPRGGLGAKEVEDFLFKANVGERSEAIEASFGGWYVAELLDKDENRELDDSQKQIVVSRLTNEWLDKLEVPVEGGKLSDDDLQHALDSLDV
jgi:parvulin-like peptidyl-prolyl isomerase